MTWSYKRFAKNFSWLLVGLVGYWLFYSFVDFTLAQTMYGDGGLANLNIVTVLHRLFVEFFTVSDGIIFIR